MPLLLISHTGNDVCNYDTVTVAAGCACEKFAFLCNAQFLLGNVLKINQHSTFQYTGTLRIGTHDTLLVPRPVSTSVLIP